MDIKITPRELDAILHQPIPICKYDEPATLQVTDERIALIGDDGAVISWIKNPDKTKNKKS